MISRPILFAEPESSIAAPPPGLVRAALKAPFPWFGGKSRVADLVWSRFGCVRNYVEPFFGSGAVLLSRSGDFGIETVNDVDAYLANFWRAVASDPDAVAQWADWPVSEPDLHARHRWLVETAAERMERVKTDPEHYDAKVAGWWVWGQCLWIGSGWCARPEWTGRVSAGRRGRGLFGAKFGKLPAIVGRDGGRGAFAESRQITRKRPSLTGKGGGLGVHKPSLGAGGWKKRPVLEQGEGGRGIFQVSHQIPDLSGDSGAAGRGILASRFHQKSGALQAYMRALSDRLRKVRVCCGDFERVLGPAVTTCIGLTGVFLDPPYPEDGRALCYNHDGPESESGRSVWWRAREWALQNGNDPNLRIALCGYDHPETAMPGDWECIAWKASGGYGRSERGKANARRERIWFSPACLAGWESTPLAALTRGEA